MRRALFIVYDFPPRTTSGVFRPLRFLKRLPDSGWTATVITARAGRGVLRDETLLEAIPRDVPVVRTAAPEPRLLQLGLIRLGLRGLASTIDRWWRLPDAQRWWVPFAVRAAARVIDSEAPDLIWSTSAPYSAHLVGRALQRRTGLPWIADLRDEWGTHPDLIPRLPTGYHRRTHERLEREVLHSADRVVGVSRTFVANLRRVAPERSPEDFRVLPNGFDEDDFGGAAPEPDRQRFVICYTGLVYGRGPLETFVRGVRETIDAGEIDPARLRVELLGHGSDELELGGLPEGVVERHGQLAHREAVARMRRAGLLLLLADPHRGPGVFPGKFFPYLAAGRPILAIAEPRSELARILDEAGHGHLAAPGDPAAVREALISGYRDWCERRPAPAPRETVVARYGSRAQTRLLASWFDDLVSA